MKPKTVYVVHDLDELTIPGVFNDLEDAVKCSHEVILSRTHDWPSTLYEAAGYMTDDDSGDEHVFQPLIQNCGTKLIYDSGDHDVFIFQIPVQ